jgi:hypothetical protein
MQGRNKGKAKVMGRGKIELKENEKIVLGSGKGTVSTLQLFKCRN